MISLATQLHDLDQDALEPQVGGIYATLFGKLPEPTKVVVHSKTDHGGVSEEKLLAMAEQADEIVALLRKEPGLQTKDVIERTGLPKSTTSLRLSRLSDEGRVFYKRKRRPGLQGTVCLWYAAKKEELPQ